MITKEHVRACVSDIRSTAEDDERAHKLEDELYRNVLIAIAEGDCVDPAEIATEALKTCRIKFNRWCA